MRRPCDVLVMRPCYVAWRMVVRHGIAWYQATPYARQRRTHMHALVVYDSQFGNTERIAAAVADTLRTTGEVRLAHVDPTHPLDLEGVDLLVLGCPTQGWRPTKAMQALLADLTPQ